ncbi:HIT family protein [Cupriavidus sp. WKF15]|uniref:HIT family protein n=1 Tax=Cupriavidus sp. WKF15 TaxID=3032282 RepID=UPI0023E24350|nr:HIT family protein [Cupriavidus sp. WKF15]WER50380.1 HIT family protein [Cupriavidus sp. WKF15]
MPNDLSRADLHIGPCRFCTSDGIIARNALAHVRYDRYPVAPGHALIIPNRHFADYFDATEAEFAALHALVREMKTRLEAEFHPDGFNVGVNIGVHAGQTVMHVHIHLIPRYAGDVGNPRGGVRGVIPARQDYGGD